MKQHKQITVELRCKEPGWSAMQLVMILHTPEKEEGYHKFEGRPTLEELPYSAHMKAPYHEAATLYLYIIPHTLPLTRDIYDTPGLPATLTLRLDNRRLLHEEISANPWGGYSRLIRLSDLKQPEE